MQVQALSSGSTLLPGQDAHYVVWVWFAGTTSGDATVSVTAQPGKTSPTFTVCPQPGTATCLVAVPTGQAVELAAMVVVPKQAAGASLTLTATATSPEAASPATGWDSIAVGRSPTPTPTPTPTTSTPTPTATTSSPTPAGVGVTLPPGTLPPGALPPGTLPPGVLPSASLPALPDPATSPGVTFPNASPAPNPLPAPSAHPIRVTDVSAQFPLDTPLIGGQIVGLAVLAAAITIAVARLSLRKQRPQHGKDPS